MSALVPVRSEPEIERSLALGLRLLDSLPGMAAALARGDLDPIDLPPIVGAADSSSLRVAAPLYLAAELEAAALLPVAELAAGLFAQGALRGDLGAAGPGLVRFYRARTRRLSPAERRAFFARVFGGPWDGPTLAEPGAGAMGPNDAFELGFIDAAEALYQVSAGHRSPGLPSAVDAVAANLAPRVSGMTAYAARDVLGTLREALRLLGDPGLQRALGGRSVWSAVEAAARRSPRRPGVGRRPRHARPVRAADPRLDRGRGGPARRARGPAPRSLPPRSCRRRACGRRRRSGLHERAGAGVR